MKLRNAIILPMVLGLVGLAHAGFIGTTFGTPGNGFAQSFARLKATTPQTGDEQLLDPLSIPFVGQLSASVGTEGFLDSAFIREAYNLGGSMLQVDVTRMDRFGRGLVASNGAWVFTVDETTRTVASGFLQTAAAT